MAAEYVQSGNKCCSRLFCGKILIFILILVSLNFGCSSSDSPLSSDKSDNSLGSDKSDSSDLENLPDRDNTPQVLTPEATGNSVLGNDIVSMDISNISKGYVMLTYNGDNEKVKFQVQGPDSKTYTYPISKKGKSITFPLTGGNGGYIFTLLEAVDAAQNMYAVAFTESADISIEDEFLPYLTPNIYVDYNSKTEAVAKGSSLSEGCKKDLDVVEKIYRFVIENVEYDTKKAANVGTGYIPNVDKTLKSKKGICFDYASLMTAMLRTQRIPTKLEVGYSKDLYHAWITCYIKDIGWVDDVIEFDGKNWTLMDPTFASSNGKKNVKNYVGDGKNYTVKFTY